MKNVFLLFAAWPLVLVAGCGQPPRVVQPQINTAAQHSTTTPIIPADAGILKKTEGDLNNDGLPDVVFVFNDEAESGNEANLHSEDVPNRILSIQFQKKGGKYEEVASSTSAIMCKTCGGLLGDPFEGVAIKKGVLIIDHYGGDHDRWGFTDTFRWQNGGFFLIGRTILTADNSLLISEKRDYNLVTGDYIISTAVPNGYKNDPALSAQDKATIAGFDTGTQKGRVLPLPLVSLEDFDINKEFDI